MLVLPPLLSVVDKLSHSKLQPIFLIGFDFAVRILFISFSVGQPISQEWTVWSQITWDQISTLVLNSCVLLDKLFNATGPQFPHLENEGNENVYFTALCEG